MNYSLLLKKPSFEKGAKMLHLMLSARRVGYSDAIDLHDSHLIRPLTVSERKGLVCFDVVAFQSIVV